MREQPLKHGSRTRIKICGLTRLEDIQAVNEAKPDFCGFIVEFPKSRRNVTVEQLKGLREELDDSILPVGVFVNAPVELPAQLLNEGTIALAQLHGQEDENYIRQLKTMTDQLLIKAFSIKTEEDVKRFAEGMDIGEKNPTMPAKLEILSTRKVEEVELGQYPSGWCSEIQLTIKEGKFHQVKRMTEAAGKKVVYLKRISMGILTLPDDLEKGECRPLTAGEEKRLKDSIVKKQVE